MNSSFEYMDIILLAMIGGFIFLRLRGILGKRTGFDGKTSTQLKEVIKNIKTEQPKKINLNFDDEAKKELISSLEKKAESEAMAFAQQSLEEAKLTVEQEAKKIIISTIQRIGTEESIENCVSVFNLDSDDVNLKFSNASSKLSIGRCIFVLYFVTNIGSPTE